MARVVMVQRLQRLFSSQIKHDISPFSQFQRRSLSLSSVLLNERRYHDKHEWVKLDGGKAVVGISEFAKDALGTIVYVQLPELNTNYSKDDEVGCVESTKSASDIFTPISGSVVEVNLELENNPSLINSSCYEDGWIYKMNVNDANKKEFESLMNEKEYNDYVKSLSH